jgi:peptidyl-tRNA hydrolase, PTH1 family
VSQNKKKIQLIVGLGNPGTEYEQTRHNVGAWLAEILANDYAGTLKYESKFMGRIARIQVDKEDYWLFAPTTFMNHSGLAVKAMAHFYKIPPESILVMHDELDFQPGVAKFKKDGGDGGHNGLRHIIAQLQNRNFYRLRIGVGHPGQRDKVIHYVLGRPSKKDFELILSSINSVRLVLPLFLAGNFEQATQLLHGESHP